MPVMALYFLDPSTFSQMRIDLPTVDTPVPRYVSDLVGTAADIMVYSSEYFSTIHDWWSIISKKRFYEHTTNPLVPRAPDTALLLLCMKLINWTPTSGESARSPLYLAAKRYYHELESTGMFTLRALQATILIALYEFGHAIFPSACLSISACVRYGQALCIDGSSDTLPKTSLDWTQQEEERRVWWALVILDHFVELFSPGRSFRTEALGLHVCLPADDVAWDQGTMAPNDQITLTLPESIHMGRFARLAQTTYLLSHVLQHIAQRPEDLSAHAEAGLQLERTILALIKVFDGENIGKESTQTTICYRYTPCSPSPVRALADDCSVHFSRCIIESSTALKAPQTTNVQSMPCKSYAALQRKCCRSINPFSQGLLCRSLK